MQGRHFSTDSDDEVGVASRYSEDESETSYSDPDWHVRMVRRLGAEAFEEMIIRYGIEEQDQFVDASLSSDEDDASENDYFDSSPDVDSNSAELLELEAALEALYYERQQQASLRKLGQLEALAPEFREAGLQLKYQQSKAYGAFSRFREERERSLLFATSILDIIKWEGELAQNQANYEETLHDLEKAKIDMKVKHDAAYCF